MTNSYEWEDTAPSDGKLKFEIVPKTIKVTLTAQDGTTVALSGKEGDTIKALVTIDPGQILSGYDATFTVTAERSGSRERTISQNITVDSGAAPQTITLNLASITYNSTDNHYTLAAKAAAACKEYKIEFTNSPTLDVEEARTDVL